MNAVIGFSPEKAWQAAIANLEMDMSRAAFSTWVKPTHLVDFSDDTFVIRRMAASAGNIPVSELPGLAQLGNSGWSCNGYPTQWDCPENLPGLDQLPE